MCIAVRCAVRTAARTYLHFLCNVLQLCQSRWLTGSQQGRKALLLCCRARSQGELHRTKGDTHAPRGLEGLWATALKGHLQGDRRNTHRWCTWQLCSMFQMMQCLCHRNNMPCITALWHAGGQQRGKASVGLVMVLQLLPPCEQAWEVEGPAAFQTLQVDTLQVQQFQNPEQLLLQMQTNPTNLLPHKTAQTTGTALAVPGWRSAAPMLLQ